MRELKYRCWYNNKIEKVHSLHLNSKKAIVSHSGGGNYSVLFDEIVLMEYIGRKDVNGVEIYEGDIIEFPGDEILCAVRYDEERNAFVLDDYGYKGSIMEYGWDENAGEFGIVDTNGFDDFYSVDGIKVVGNIYENKDLITR